MQKSASMVLLMAAALSGCAGVDGIIDRYTTHYQQTSRDPDATPVAAAAALPPGVTAGLYAGDTSPAATNAACPQANAGTLDVGRGQVRYSDPANGMIEGPIGPDGQVALNRGGIRLDGRLVADRFAGTVSGGACAYDLAFRRGGEPAAVASAAPVGEAPAPDAPVEASATPPAPAVAQPVPQASPPAQAVVAEAPGTTPRQQVAAADTDDDGRFDAVLTRLRSRRYARHSETPAGSDTPANQSQDTHQHQASRTAPPVAPVPVTAPPPPPPPPAEADTSPAAEANRMLAAGHIASARPLYERAAALGDAAAATALGKTYDPLFLSNMHADAMQPDPALAAAWYKRGAALGDPRAASRLSSLLAMEKQ